MTACACELSILVVSRSADNLRGLLQALSGNLPKGTEILCSLNGEQPCAELDLDAFPGFQIQDHHPYNFGENNNVLAQRARGQFVLFLNDDVRPDPGALSKALDYLKDEAIGMVGANLRFPSGLLQHAGVFFQENMRPYHRFKRALPWDAKEVDANLFVPAITGAFIMMRRDEFLEVKFENSFSVAGEDIVLCLAYRSRFRRGVFYAPDVSALHVESVTRDAVGQSGTPADDMQRILDAGEAFRAQGVALNTVLPMRVRAVTQSGTEEPLLTQRVALLAERIGAQQVTVDAPSGDAEITYVMSNGPVESCSKDIPCVVAVEDGKAVSGIGPDLAKVADHYMVTSQAIAAQLQAQGVPQTQVTVADYGMAPEFRPKMILGLMAPDTAASAPFWAGVAELQQDPEIAKRIDFVAYGSGAGICPVMTGVDRAVFYRAIDHLFVAHVTAGARAHVREALACGTRSFVAAEMDEEGLDMPCLKLTGDQPLAAQLLDVAIAHERQKAGVCLAGPRRALDSWATLHQQVFARLLVGAKGARWDTAANISSVPVHETEA